MNQLWHVDGEDLVVVKVILFLTDVSEASGPTYILPCTHATGRQCFRKIEVMRRMKRNYVGDSAASMVLPNSKWKRATGPRMTLGIYDTTALHKGGFTHEGERKVLLATYVAQNPVKFAAKKSYMRFSRELLKNLDWLDEFQRAHLSQL